MTEGNIDRLNHSPQGARQEWLGMLLSLAEQIQKQQQTSSSRPSNSSKRSSR